jgi:ribonuclease HII
VPRPSLRRERAAWADDLLLVGVDEAGRGPLAGPVVAAAVVFPPGCTAVRGLRDSKILPPVIRGRLAERIRRRALGYGIGAASSREIDRFNIRVATALAMRRAIRHLLQRVSLTAEPTLPACRIPLPPGRPCLVVIDGLPLPEVGYAHEAIVDGDALCQSISAAAILAKTVRDLLMHRLAPRYPNYGWETNVGYGTPEHQEGIRLHGPTRHHRLTFEPLAQLTLPF